MALQKSPHEFLSFSGLLKKMLRFFYILNIIGASVSSAALLMAIMVLLILRKIRSTRNFIHCNLFMSIIVSTIFKTMLFIQGLPVFKYYGGHFWPLTSSLTLKCLLTHQNRFWLWINKNLNGTEFSCQSLLYHIIYMHVYLCIKAHDWVDTIDICAITFLSIYGTILQMTWTLFEGIFCLFLVISDIYF